MRSVKEQAALIKISDGLAGLPAAGLLGVRPHPTATDSVIVELAAAESGYGIELRLLAEDVYRETGVLVLFREPAIP